MTNKETIKKLRDNAELAWAAYGYYDKIKLIDKHSGKTIQIQYKQENEIFLLEIPTHRHSQHGM